MGSSDEVQSDDRANITDDQYYKNMLDATCPMLQVFREKCPGTFKHCQSLASMVEGISMALDLDVNLMKTVALYHDIGKTFNAKWFTENQLEDVDPHLNIDPKISYEIITRHVSDSVMILINEPNFPRKAIEIISQHHGQTVLQYFFKKSGKDVEDLYRYKGSKPTCIESAVLMVCDMVEAMSRSLVQANRYDPQLVIEETINNLIDDGQLDEVTMKLGDLKRIKLALAKELEGTYQKRIDYAKATSVVEDISMSETTVSGGGKL